MIIPIKSDKQTLAKKLRDHKCLRSTYYVNLSEFTLKLFTRLDRDVTLLKIMFTG